MNIQEHVPLAPLTTLGVGGPARFFIEAHAEKDIEEAIAFARERDLPLIPLGGGSNVLVPDAGIPGVVLKIAMRDVVLEDEGESVLLIADAGAPWDDAVDAAGEHGLFGIENLAGIPGTVGGAAVQNIGAYGAELSTVFAYADVIDGARHRIARADAAFGYRTSFFKQHSETVIVRVALRLAKRAKPDTTYADVARAAASGAPLTTPREVATAIRAIRAAKFPHVPGEGTAGSFFKNPVISAEVAASLTERFPDLPTFPQENGGIKIQLAWLLDHVLALKGYAMGPVRLYERQPLVLVARAGATAADIDVLAREVAERVHEAVGIVVEREVETFGKNFFQ